MLRLSKKTLLAVEAVVDVAYYARPNPVQSKDITARLGVPQRYLEQVMQQLVKAGILKGVRGPRGGYRLARERRRISVGDVVKVVCAMEAADEPHEPSAMNMENWTVGPFWARVEKDLGEQLDKVSIDALCCELSGQNGGGQVSSPTVDFTI